MKQNFAVDAAKHAKLRACPLCKRSVSQLSGMVCASCDRSLMDVRKKASALKTPEGRLDEKSNRAIAQSTGTVKKDDGQYAISLFEMVCFGGGIAILIGYLISEFYFTLAVVIVMVFAVIALVVESIEIR